MPIPEYTKRSIKKYDKKFHRFGIRVLPEEYEKIKQAAHKKDGGSVNGYVCRLIREDMEKAGD